MAKIIYSLGELAGSIGANTFQRNSSGTIVRSRPLKNKKSTVRQQRAHQKQQHWIQQWQQLEESERDLWNEFAAAHDKVNKFGQTKTLTGANWFQSLNFMRDLMGESFLAEPPTYEVAADAPEFDIVATATELFIDITGEIDWDTTALIVWATPPTTRSTATVNRIRKFVIVQAADPSGPLDLTLNWGAATGITWLPESLFPSTNIFICIEAINKASGITGPLLCQSFNTSSLETLDPDYLAYVAEFDTPPTGPREILLNQFFVDIKAAGYFDLLDRLYFYWSEEEQQCTISLKNPTATPLDLVNGTHLTFTASRGIAGDAAGGYCDTNFIPSSDGENYTLNKAVYGLYIRTNVAEDKVDMGVYNSPNPAAYFASRWSNGNYYAQINTAGANQIVAANSDSRGMWSIRRTASNRQSLNHNGSEVGFTTDASTSLDSSKIFTNGYNNAGPSLTSTKQIGMVFIGSSDIDDAGFYSLIQDFATAIGANV